jgi:type IV secretory pathway TrbD component
MNRTLFEQPLTEVSTTRKEALGAVIEYNGKWYKYVMVKNSATVAGAAGDPVSYFAATGYDDNRVVVRDADADAQPIGAGILQGTVAGVADTSYYCWIQIRGVATVLTAVASGVVGSGVMMGSSDKTMTIATGTVCAPIGILLTASAANNKILCNFPI